MDNKNKIIETFVENPELLKAENIIDMIDVFKPEIYKIAGYLFDCYKDLVSNEDYYKTIAKDKANLFNSLLEEGFDRAEALQILLDNNTSKLLSKITK